MKQFDKLIIVKGQKEAEINQKLINIFEAKKVKYKLLEKEKNQDVFEFLITKEVEIVYPAVFVKGSYVGSYENILKLSEEKNIEQCNIL